MDERSWAHWWQPKCPAVAWIGPGNFPRCELRLGHEGSHAAERGMFDEVWTEAWTT